MWKQIDDLFAPPDSTIAEVLRVIEQGGISIALITDADGHLLGTVTDGDIRRALLRGMSIETPAEFIMNRHPVTAPSSSTPGELLTRMTMRRKKQIPLVHDGHVVDVAVIDQLLGRRPTLEVSTTPVVLMCGGLGMRLRPLTETTPKPLLPVHGRPLIEHTLERLSDEGFRSVFITTFHRPESFDLHDIRGERWGIDIQYVQEPRRMGTAGALGLLRAELTEPFLVVNGDVLTQMRFRALLDFHRENDFLLTLSVKPRELRIPYGVVEVEHNHVRCLVEKPVQTCLTNAGVYAMNPEVLEMIPAGEFVDMDSVIQMSLDSNARLGAFPVYEYWTDIGHPSTYEEARRQSDE